ncbi:hypothetical protein [Sphingomonas zeae]
MRAFALERKDRRANAQRFAASGREGAAFFAAIGRAYVRGDLANPALVRLIFISSAQLQTTGEVEALRTLRSNAAKLLPSGVVSSRPRQGRYWHGHSFTAPPC